MIENEHIVTGDHYPHVMKHRLFGGGLLSFTEGGFMSQDRQLQEAVLAEFAWEPSITAAHIGVTASAGVVTLTGHVENYYEKHAAEKAAARVKGVKAVAGEIEVKLPYAVKRSDEDIARAVIDRLAWEVTIPRDSVKVKVDKGWVSLSGEVAWHYQKEAAERHVRGLFGVVAVTNQIAIKPRVDTAHLSDDIQHALHRSWFFDAEKVHVTALDGHIRLTGTVGSWQEKSTASSTAWAAAGATSVENDLVIA